MKSLFSWLVLSALALPLCSCLKEDERRKPVGPVSENSSIPWNQPVPGQGQGQFGMLPQNQYRR